MKTVIVNGVKITASNLKECYKIAKLLKLDKH